MEIKKVSLGYVQTNTYFLKKDEKMIIIDPCLDPGQNSDRIFKAIGDSKVVAILLTHGHFDHISGVDTIVDKYSCPVFIPQNELGHLRNTKLNLSENIPEKVIVNAEAQGIEEGFFELDGFKFEVIKTPGHTADSVSYIFDNHIFDGDFIFYRSIGRTDLIGGSMPLMVKSIRSFVDLYKDQNPVLYPGHGDITNLKEEIEHNPFLKQIL